MKTYSLFVKYIPLAIFAQLLQQCNNIIVTVRGSRTDALHSHVGGDWRRRSGHPHARWTDQLRNDTGVVPTNLRKTSCTASLRGHDGATRSCDQGRLSPLTPMTQTPLPSLSLLLSLSPAAKRPPEIVKGSGGAL